MKLKTLFLFSIILLLVLQAVNAVEIKGFVNDYANIIDDASEKELDSRLQQLYDSGTAQFAIVTLHSLDGKDIESYSLDLAQGVLGDKEKNNGLLLLVALEEREYRFEVGRGLEAVLTDSISGRIGRDYLVPNFRAGDYGTGIVEAAKAVQSVLTGDTASEYYVTEQSVDETIYLIFYFIFFIMIFVLPILAFFLKRKKFKNRYFNAAAGAIILFGNRGGRGGSGGGFGGFGGGSFGGGGSSGGW